MIEFPGGVMGLAMNLEEDEGLSILLLAAGHKSRCSQGTDEYP